jgi:hypothetical protein
MPDFCPVNLRNPSVMGMLSHYSDYLNVVGLAGVIEIVVVENRLESVAQLQFQLFQVITRTLAIQNEYISSCFGFIEAIKVSVNP